MAARQGAVLFGLILGALANAPVHAQVTIFDVPPQSLVTALIEFAEEAGLSIDFSGLKLDGVMSGGTQGHISRNASLRTILDGSGIHYRFLDDSTVQLFVPAQPQSQQQPTAPVARHTARQADFIEDLVVTAVKRPAVGFDLPVSVSGLSGLVLDDLGVHDFQSLAPHLAGVSTTNLGPGRNKIFVRGLSDGPFADRTQAMVGVYIDETPVNLNDTNPDLRLFDVDRIELVRGPQGTLYGAGSMGGLYRVITKKPDVDDTSARVRTTLSGTKGGGLGGQLDFMVNHPLIPGRLGLRVTGYGEQREGYIDNVGLSEKNTNNLDIFGIRPALRWQINERWNLEASINYQTIHYDDSQYFDDRLGRNQRANLLPEPYEDGFIHLNMTVKGRIGSLHFTSATALIDRTVKETTDASEGLLFFDELANLPPSAFIMDDLSSFAGVEEFLEVIQPENAVAYFTRDDIDTFSHETRLQSAPGHRFEWLAGFYFLRRLQTKDTALALAFDIRDARLALWEDRTETTEDIAVFGEAIFRASDKLSFTAGARFSRNELKLDYVSEFVLDDERQTVNGKKKINKVIPKVAVQYTWSDQVQTYAQVGVGYRVGGLNIDTPLEALVAADPDEPFPAGRVTEFLSDDLISYEAGIKSYWFDRRLSVNMSAFYVHWYDIQSDQIGDSGFPYVTNVGDAKNVGYELEFSVSPFDGLELKGSFFWNDSELLEDNAFLGAVKGDRLPAISENTASLALLYQFTLGPKWDGAFSADYAYIGKSALTFNEAESPQMGDFGILNVRLQVSNDIWKMGLFAQNLSDTRANTFSFGNSFTVLEGHQVTPPRPRTFGLFLERRF